MVVLTMPEVPYNITESVSFTRALLRRLPDIPGQVPLEVALNITRLVVDVMEVRHFTL